MHWDDIKKFTSCGNYYTNVPVMHIESTLTYYKEEYGLELNPDFQRGNVWTEAQQIAYLEYFFRGGQSAKDIYFNCPDFSYNSGSSNGKLQDIHNMVCVDGLQRLTAFRRFLRDELPIFGGHYFSDFEGKPRSTEYALVFHVNSLLTRREVLTWYIEMNSGGTIHTSDEIARVKAMLEEA